MFLNSEEISDLAEIEAASNANSSAQNARCTLSNEDRFVCFATKIAASGFRHIQLRFQGSNLKSCCRCKRRFPAHHVALAATAS